MEKTQIEEINYWLFSNSEEATFARARGEYPLELFDCVTEAEADQICAKIRERLENGKFYRIYVNVLVYFHDRSAVDILRKWEQHFEEKRRVGKHFGITCSSEIRSLKEAIEHLEHL